MENMAKIHRKNTLLHATEQTAFLLQEIPGEIFNS